MTKPSTSRAAGRELRRRAAVRIGIGYALQLAFAHVVAALAVTATLISLLQNTVGDARALLTDKNVITTVVLISVSAVAGAIADVVNVFPSLHWFAEGRVPSSRQRRAAIRIPARQTAVHLTVWILSGAVFTVMNLDRGAAVAVLIGLVILSGAASTACICHLLTQRTLRPIITMAMQATTPQRRAPGVLARLMIVWMIFSTSPMMGVALLVAARANGWFVETTAAVERPVLVLTLVSLVLGMRAMALTARSISDPVGDVVLAMGEVERGRTTASVGVYESSQIGSLQIGFNQMVDGLAERERLRDVFGRHVGADVAVQAMVQDSVLSGDVRHVGVLFIDLVGSTQLAAARAPWDVASILSQFFQIVVAEIDRRNGTVNKFQGDAVLAVFGAPLAIHGPTSAALATGRTLAIHLRALPEVDFGIGVSAGTVFAGNVGAENRYEYTVIGDAVNEAARLADYAKEQQSRVACSGAAAADADVSEREHWEARGFVGLRGRPEPTMVSVPIETEPASVLNEP